MELRLKEILVQRDITLKNFAQIVLYVKKLSPLGWLN